MDAGFLATWDTWLAEGLLQLRQQQGEAWLAAYLASPSWRFLLMPGAMPGAAGAQAWAGVLMPSVDKVGRYFPFTLVWPLAVLPGAVEQQRMLWAWLGRLDELAGDALHDDWTLERLEDELARMALPTLLPLPAVDPPGLPAAAGAWLDEALSAGPDIAGHLGHQAQALWQAQTEGLAYWAASPAATGAAAPRLRISRGLPASAGALLGATMPAALPPPIPP
jgi:type VI secretion system protein ImpM